ncbi:hypothetical protein V6N13_069328 [Hibiscus sabdariffa]
MVLEGPSSSLWQRLAVVLVLVSVYVRAEDPYRFFTWNVTYGDVFPLGVRQQGILINGQFPGPDLYSKLKARLDGGHKLPFPDGILINGRGPNGAFFTVEQAILLAGVFACGISEGRVSHPKECPALWQGPREKHYASLKHLHPNLF